MMKLINCTYWLTADAYLMLSSCRQKISKYLIPWFDAITLNGCSNRRWEEAIVYLQKEIPALPSLVQGKALYTIPWSCQSSNRCKFLKPLWLWSYVNHRSNAFSLFCTSASFNLEILIWFFSAEQLCSSGKMHEFYLWNFHFSCFAGLLKQEWHISGISIFWYCISLFPILGSASNNCIK